MLVKPHVLLVKTPFHSKWHVLDVHMNILRSLVYVGLYLYIWWLHHSVQPCFLGCYIAKKRYVCRLISSYLHHLFFLDSTDKCQWFSVWKLNEWYKEKCKSRYSRCLCHWFYHIKSERNGIMTYS
jgi:hypothetical protein